MSPYPVRLRLTVEKVVAKEALRTPANSVLDVLFPSEIAVLDSRTAATREIRGLE